MIKHSFKGGLFFVALLSSAHVLAVENPLKLQVRFNIPSDISSVHQAANYLIAPHGYRVQYAPSAPREAINIGRQSLPINLPVDKLLDIESALLSVLDDDQILIVDTKNKLISFGSK